MIYIIGKWLNICLQANLQGLPSGADAGQLHFELFIQRKLVGGGRIFFSVDWKTGIGRITAGIVKPEILYRAGSLAGVVIADSKDLTLPGSQPGGIWSHPQGSTPFGLRQRSLDTDVCIVDQTNQTLLYLPVGLILAYGKLELIIHVIDIYVKGIICIRFQRHLIIRKK